MQILGFLRPLAVFLGMVAGHAWAVDVRVLLPGGDALVLPTPDGWRSSTRSGPVTTVSLKPAGGAVFEVLVSPFVAPDGRPVTTSSEALRRSVEGAANEAKTQSVERSLPVHSFASGNVQGYYFSATDRAPKPGEFKYLTQGTVSVAGLPVAFTILSSGNPQASVEPALRMLGAARRE